MISKKLNEKKFDQNTIALFILRIYLIVLNIDIPCNPRRLQQLILHIHNRAGHTRQLLRQSDTVM